MLVTPLSNFSLTPDTVSWEDWVAALSEFDARLLGQRHRLFPSDPAGLWRTGEALREWCGPHPRRCESKLTVDELMPDE